MVEMSLPAQWRPEELARIRGLLDQERGTQDRLAAEIADLGRKAEAAKAHLMDLVSREAQYRNVHQNASNNRESLKRRLRRTDEEEAQTQKRIAEAQEREGRATARLEAVKTETETLTGRIAETRTRLDERSKALGAAVKQTQTLELERTTVRSRFATLKKMEDNFEWYKDGVKAVMKHARTGTSTGDAGLEGIVALVADVIEPAAAAATAVASGQSRPSPRVASASRLLMKCCAVECRPQRLPTGIFFAA